MIGHRIRLSLDQRRFAARARHEFDCQRFISDLLARHIELSSPGRLAPFEHRVFSQNGEDGVIAEIFVRIETTNRSFVEFGCGDGIENNTLHLLHEGWNGLWLDGNAKLIDSIRASHGSFIDGGSLRLEATMVTAENIESVLSANDVESELDLLSIDIDGNDYWVWEAIEEVNPRVVVVEYNAMWPASSRWVKAYNATECWDGSSHHGASLGALAALGEIKGYTLVHCDLSGVNAFFVRSDLVADRFAPDASVGAHYQPARYFLASSAARRRSLGSFETV